jgi:hypothetical protein
MMKQAGSTNCADSPANKVISNSARATESGIDSTMDVHVRRINHTTEILMNPAKILIPDPCRLLPISPGCF